MEKKIIGKRCINSSCSRRKNLITQAYEDKVKTIKPEVSDYAKTKFCENCGDHLKVIIEYVCCGKSVGGKFCPYCGEKKPE